MTSVKHVGRFIVALILLLVFQQCASFIGGRVAEAVGYTAADTQKPYMWISIHHIVQLALGLAAIFALWKARRMEFYLRPAMDKRGVVYLVVFSVIVCAVTAIGYKLMYASYADIPYGYELNSENIAGMLGFQLLLSGPSEEILFRALTITVLCTALGADNANVGKPARWVAVIASSILFALAHVSWYTDPFRLSFSWFQLGYSFLFGLAYGFVYLRVKSVVYPMLMHSVSNIIMVGMGYALKLMVK